MWSIMTLSLPTSSLSLCAALLSLLTLLDDDTFHNLGHEWHTDIVQFVRHDIPKLLVIVLLGFALLRAVSFAERRIRRLADGLVSDPRRASQLRTLAAILRATAVGVIAFLGLLQILPLFNIDLKPLLASAGVVGLGISFGAQSLFKDMLNGLFILVEDQFNVGDVVKVAGLTGTVEDLTLRSTRLRDGDGTLYFVPNSQIATVSNLSREFSVASLAFSVDAATDPDQVIVLLRAVAMDVRQDKAFADVVLGDPDVPGLDRLSGREAVYPVNLKVKANQKDGVLRELRKRLLLACEKEGIALGVPTSAVVMERAFTPTAPDPTATPPAAPGLPGSV